MSDAPAPLARLLGDAFYNLLIHSAPLDDSGQPHLQAAHLACAHGNGSPYTAPGAVLRWRTREGG